MVLCLCLASSRLISSSRFLSSSRFASSSRRLVGDLWAERGGEIFESETLVSDEDLESGWGRGFCFLSSKWTLVWGRGGVGIDFAVGKGAGR